MARQIVERCLVKKAVVEFDPRGAAVRIVLEFLEVSDANEIHFSRSHLQPIMGKLCGGQPGSASGFGAVMNRD